MTTKIVIEANGKELEIPIDLTESQLRDLCVVCDAADSNEAATGYEAPEEGGTYYFKNSIGQVQQIEATDVNEPVIRNLYDKGNCFTDEELARSLARGATLIRQLRRLSIEAREVPLDFCPADGSSQVGGYTILYNFHTGCLEIGATGHWKALGDIVFPSELAAQNAINEYREELLWYFTEMQECL